MSLFRSDRSDKTEKNKKSSDPRIKAISAGVSSGVKSFLESLSDLYGNIFSPRKSEPLSRGRFAVDLVFSIVVAIILNSIFSDYSILITLFVLFIPMISAVSRRIRDAGLRWYLYIVSIAIIFVGSFIGIAATHKSIISLNELSDNVYVSYSALVDASTTAQILFILAAIAGVATAILLIIALFSRKDRYSDAKVFPKFYIVLSIVTAALLCAGIINGVTSIKNVIDTQSYTYESSKPDGAIEVNGVFTPDMDDYSSDYIMQFYTLQADDSSSSFDKFKIDDFKIQDNLYVGPVFAQNSTNEGEDSSHPLIIMSVVNTGDSDIDITIDNVKIAGEDKEYSNTVTASAGKVSFIAIRLSSDALSGNEEFQANINDKTVYSVLYDIDYYTTISSNGEE